MISRSHGSYDGVKEELAPKEKDEILIEDSLSEIGFLPDDNVGNDSSEIGFFQPYGSEMTDPMASTDTDGQGEEDEANGSGLSVVGLPTVVLGPANTRTGFVGNGQRL